MSELQVEIPQLRAFGTQFHTFGTGNVGATGEATRIEAGQTADMDGLLDIIAPAIHETAVVFGQHYDNLADAQKAGAPTLNVGLFINAIIQFLIVSFAVFWVVKALTRLNVRQDAVAATTKSEVLLGEIRDLLKAKL